MARISGRIPPSRKGHVYSLQERINHSIGMQKGAEHWNWKGGVGRWRPKSLEWKLWREAVLNEILYLPTL